MPAATSARTSATIRRVIPATFSRPPRTLGERSLEPEQEASTVVVPAVAPERRPGAHDAVTGNEQLDRAARERAARRAAGATRPGRGGDVPVRPQLAVRDRADGLEHAPGEAAADLREVGGRLEGTESPAEVRLDLAADRRRPAPVRRRLALEIVLAAGPVVVEACGSPRLAREDRERPQGRVDGDAVEHQIGGQGNGRRSGRAPGSGRASRPPARARPGRPARARRGGWRALRAAARSRRRRPAGEVLADGLLDRLADEVPDHRPELRLVAEAHAVVDDVDPPSSPRRQWPALRSALLITRSKAATRRNSAGTAPRA